jgi:CheY-like chemotaxis protein
MEDQKVILVVDDNPENIDVLAGMLRSSYKVKAATSGEKALKSSKKSPPDLILLDIMMPEMDGYQVFEQLLSDPITAKIPVVFATGMSDSEDQKKGMDMGARGYLTKPVDPEKVYSLVNEILS